MIAPPKPGSDLWRVLALIVAHNGQLDAGAIAGALRPYQASDPAPPLVWSPTGASAAYRDWLASVGGRHQTEEAHRRTSAEWAATCLQRLTSIGLLVPARSRAAELSLWFMGMAAEGGDEAALSACLRAGESDALDEVEEDGGEERRKGVADMLALIAKVRLCGKRGREGWSEAAAYTRLIEAGVVIPPSYRWATDAGIALVQGAK